MSIPVLLQGFKMFFLIMHHFVLQVFVIVEYKIDRAIKFFSNEHLNVSIYASVIMSKSTIFYLFVIYRYFRLVIDIVLFLLLFMLNCKVSLYLNNCNLEICYFLNNKDNDFFYCNLLSLVL